MRARLAVVRSAVIAVLLALVVAVPVSAAPTVTQWHRLNPDPINVANEHERLTCFESGTSLRCLYDKVPGEGLHVDEATGAFRGHDVTDRWECPDWFDPEICENVTAVYAGPATYYPDSGTPFTVYQEYVFTDLSGQPVLIQYWPGFGFACPWFETFAEAMAANPTGDFDCMFAP